MSNLKNTHHPNCLGPLVSGPCNCAQAEIKRLQAALVEAARHLDNAAATARAYDDDDWCTQTESAAASARASAGTSPKATTPET